MRMISLGWFFIGIRPEYYKFALLQEHRKGRTQKITVVYRYSEMQYGLIAKSISHPIQIACIFPCPSSRILMSKALNIIKRFIQEKEQSPELIKEFDLTGTQIRQFTPEIKTALEQCKSLESLILCECDLISLKNLPQLPKLQELDLSTNSLSDDELKHLSQYKELIILNIADNKIQKMETLQKLKKPLSNLVRLDCADNKLEHLPGYFKNVFALFPKLECLDNKDKEGREVEFADFEDDEDLQEYDDQDDEDDQDDDQSEKQAKPKKKQKIENSESEQQVEDYSDEDDDSNDEGLESE